jgi:hypothetical protein
MTGIVGGLVLLSCLAGIAAGLAHSPKPAWFFIMFEVVGLLPSVFAILFAMGRIQGSASMTLACIGGSILVVAVLGGFSIQWQVAGIGLKVPEGLRVLAAIMLGASSVSAALGADRQRWAALVKGSAFGVGFAVVAGLTWKVLGPGSGGSMHAGLRALLVSIAYLLATGLLAAAVQVLVGAFRRAD